MVGQAVRVDRFRVGVRQAAIAEFHHDARVVFARPVFRCMVRGMQFGLLQEIECGVFPVFVARGRQPVREKTLQCHFA
jgi:hypothetical protein